MLNPYVVRNTLTCLTWGLSASLTGFQSRQIFLVMPKLPPRRLLAVATAIALIGSNAHATSARDQPKNGVEQVCPLGSFHCTTRPYNYSMCRPNALLEFYDPFLSKDSTVRDTSTTFSRAQHVDSSNQTVYHLSGNVNLQRADQELHADTAAYNDDTSDYDAQGNVRYQDAGSLLAAAHMRGNNNASTGVADGDLRYQMLKSRGNGVAQRGEMFDSDHRLYSIATYSTCDLGHHIWEIHAKSILQDYVKERGVARDATIRVFNVPILYLPYFTFPLDNERQTGFLTPILSNTSRAGFRVMAPYYLNLAPNYDATLTPSVFTSRGEMLGGQFRYLFPGYTGQLDAEFLPNDQSNDSGTAAQTKGEDRYLVKYISVSHLWDSWSLSTNINHASDRNYLYDFGSLLDNSAIGTLTSSVYASGGGTWWNASVGGDVYQNVNPFLPDTVNPYNRLPRATLNFNVPISRWLEFGMNNEAVAFTKNEYSLVNQNGVTSYQRDFVDGNRLDLYPFLAADFQGSYWFVKPKVAYRYTAYDLDSNYGNYGYGGLLASGQTSPFTEQSPSRALPITSIDSGLIFDRSTTLFGNSYTQTLEPRLYYLYVPYRNQNNLPLFDTSLMTFDYWQLFSPNQYSGADRQMNANDLTGALTTRLLDENGVERVSASFGQITYFTPQRVQLPTGQTTVAPSTDWSGSDYVAQLNLQLADRWRLNTTYQWSPNTDHTDMATVELQHRLGTDGVLNFSYHYLNGLLKQFSVSAVYPLSDRWRLMGSWTYAQPIKGLATSISGTVEALAGVEYDNCCVTLRLVDRSYVDQTFYGQAPLAPGSSTNLRNNAIMFEVVFKGIGSSGGEIDPLLRRDILGYQ